MARKSFMSASKPVVKINAAELLRELTVDGPNSKRMAYALREVIEPKIKESQKELEKEFKIHPITIELNAGPRAANTSGTLGGYGNLFSFIGFSGGAKPTEIISQIFNQKIKFTVRRVNNKGKFKVTFYIPSIEEIYNLTPIPWMTGKSWARSVEEGGLTNLGQFLFSAKGFGQSNSGTGMQVKNRSSGVRFNRTPYIGKLIGNFRNNLLSLGK
jgi:hypothetical protein|tara:strand:- start:1184 stop:1825 length:642 start_codon:yes stop_codon:yes gene_type:complete